MKNVTTWICSKRSSLGGAINQYMVAVAGRREQKSVTIITGSYSTIINFGYFLGRVIYHHHPSHKHPNKKERLCRVYPAHPHIIHFPRRTTYFGGQGSTLHLTSLTGGRASASQSESGTWEPLILWRQAQPTSCSPGKTNWDNKFLARRKRMTVR